MIIVFLIGLVVLGLVAFVAYKINKETLNEIRDLTYDVVPEPVRAEFKKRTGTHVVFNEQGIVEKVKYFKEDGEVPVVDLDY